MTPSSLSDAERRSAFEALFEEHYGAVQRAAARRVPASQIDDVVAATFLVVWRHVDDLPASIVPWLHGVVRRVAANERRAVARQVQLAERIGQQVESPFGARSGSAHPRLHSESESEGPVMRAFSELSSGDQEVLALVTWDGLSSEEAAQALGIRSGTLRVRLHRALRRLERRSNRATEAAESSGSSKELVHD